MKVVEGILLLLGGMALMVVSALLTALFIWAGWNLGVVDASGGRLPEVSLGTAFWMSVFASSVGHFFKSELKQGRQARRRH